MMRLEPWNPFGDEDTRYNVVDNPKAAEQLWVYSRALLIDGRPIAVMLIQPRWTGVGYAVVLPSLESLTEHGLSLHKATLKVLEYAETTLSMRRIEASVRVGYEAGVRWIEALGFEREGLMRNYGPGAKGDFWLYARITA